MTAVENLSIAMAAKQLQMTEGAVLVARCRVLARLRQAIAEIESLDDAQQGDRR